MKLKLIDRIILGNILPQEGNIKTIVIVKDIREKIKITQEDFKEYEIVVNGANLQWNSKGIEAEFDIDFTEFEKNEAKLAIQKADKDKKMTVDMLHLSEVFGVIGE